MFKKIIKVILILLAIFLIILGVIWLIGRHKAAENGSKPLSFKQFLGIGTELNPAQTTAGSGTSGFNSSTTGGLGNGNNTGPLGNGNNGNTRQYVNQTNASQFTNSGTAPTGNFGLNGPGNGTNGNGGGANGNGSGSNNGNGGTGDNGTGIGSTNSALVCGSADTNITFTPTQLAELTTLQNRFYALAQTLHTDADVATEVANHDAFALRADQVTELYNYCEAALPNITDPRLQQHLPTPFWHAWLASDTPANLWNTSSRPDQDEVSFLDYNAFDRAHMEDIHDNNTDNPDTVTRGPYGLLSFSNPQEVNIDGSSLTGDTQLLVPVVERILRINLW